MLEQGLGIRPTNMRARNGELPEIKAEHEHGGANAEFDQLLVINSKSLRAGGIGGRRDDACRAGSKLESSRIRYESWSESGTSKNMFRAAHAAKLMVQVTTA